MIKVYFRQDDGTIDHYLVDGGDHAEAILKVCEELVASGEGYNKPVLAVIEGGKKDG